jgi:hypothetical protein
VLGRKVKPHYHSTRIPKRVLPGMTNKILRSLLKYSATPRESALA